MKKQIGIWLDYREANIIELTGDESTMNTLPSEVDTSRPKGGSRTKGAPYGPMDKISESKYLERRKQQEAAYFEQIIAAVQEADELYIFGPAEAKDGLAKAIRQNPTFKPLLRAVETADSMTINQKVAKVKAFFGT